jgi:hypothetical protein
MIFDWATSRLTVAFSIRQMGGVMKQALAEFVLLPRVPSSSSMHGGLLLEDTILATPYYHVLRSDAPRAREQLKCSGIFDLVRDCLHRVQAGVFDRRLGTYKSRLRFKKIKTCSGVLAGSGVRRGAATRPPVPCSDSHVVPQFFRWSTDHRRTCRRATMAVGHFFLHNTTYRRSRV